MTRRTVLAFFLGLVAVVPALLPAPARAAGPDEPFRVMTFNIRFDNPQDGEDAWPHRREKAASMIRFHGAGIVGLQEALRRQIDDLQAALPGFAWVGVPRVPGKDDEHCAVFCDKDRFELLEEGTFWLSPTPAEPGSRGWDAALPRTATWVKLRDRRGGASFHVFNTHFDHRGEEARRQSARLLLRQVVTVAGATAAAIVMGDLNATPDSEAYRTLTSPGPGEGAPPPLLRDAFLATRSPHHGPTSSWNGFKAIQPGRRIDYVLVTPGIDVRQHGILSDTFDGRFPSDHLPVLAEVAIRPAGAVTP
jgi:endonuclease/exonuclease/phosphatase family metal-dependent hydrolase